MALRRRLMLLAAGTVGFTLLVAAVACYAAMRSELRGQVDDALTHQANLVGRVVSREGLVLPQRAPAAPPGEAAGYIQVIDADGNVTSRSDTGTRLRVTAEDRRIAAGTQAARLSDRRVDGLHLRVHVIPVAEGGAIQLARSLKSGDTVLTRLRLVLAIIVLAGTAFALTMSRMFARRVVAPVTELASAAEHISTTHDLTRRIENPGEDEVGRLALRFNTMLDILQASRAELASSVASQRQLVADASHELRTPITSLRTNIELLRDGRNVSDDERRAMLDDVLEQSEELSGLINDVIELGRGDEPITGPEAVMLDEVVADAVGRVRRHAPLVNFAVELEPTEVSGSAERLARAVTNLLDNATKHTPQAGTVDVTLSGGALAVRDRGAGVPDADKPHIFDRFYRGQTSRGAHGSGLGLAIVKQAAEAHGGTVSVADAPDGGALFTLSVPVRRRAERAMEPT